MENMINLNDLLKHEILDLYSVEEQIIEALPAMIEKADNADLKKALKEHLKITEEQKKRLDQVKQIMNKDESSEAQAEQKPGFFSRLFASSEGDSKCKGMEGIIKEGEKMMTANATQEVLDAAIIASAQKVEHYEICGYGTARTYARELKLNDVADLLEQTLNEEYKADDILTELAVSKINMEAEQTNGIANGQPKLSAKKSSGNNKNANGSQSSKQGNQPKAKKSAPGKSNNAGAKKGSSSAKNNSSKGSSSSQKNSKSGSSSKDKSNGQPAAKKGSSNKPSAKKSSGNNKKSAGKKAGALRNR